MPRFPKMASLSARQLALEVCSGVIPADCPPPSEEEQRQLMAVMAEYEWLAQQQLQLYAFGNEAIMDLIEIQSECQTQQPPCVAAGNDVISNETLMSLMEMQSESQTQHQPCVIAGMDANTNVQDHTGDYQEVNRLLEQLQVLNREPQPLSPLLQSLFQAIQLLDDKHSRSLRMLSTSRATHNKDHYQWHQHAFPNSINKHQTQISLRAVPVCRPETAAHRMDQFP